MRNELDKETSPYLLQHRDNPVHWQTWSEDTIAASRQADKPILLSVGYAACHWCHVMAHESFEDPDTAALMNELFINVKVDREERPDLDMIYQTALAITGQQGGWPLTMFLTPEGAPFWGGTYFPPDQRYGRPAFRDVLRQVEGVYREHPERVSNNVTAIAQRLEAIFAENRGSGIPLTAAPELAAHFLSEHDPVYGGFGDAPKFPQPTILKFLWRTACARIINRFCKPYAVPSPLCAKAEFMIIWEAVSPAIQPMLNGWPRISRKCFTTMPSLSL